MKLNVYKNYEVMSANAADEIIATVKQKPDAVLCLASGDTPRLAYQLMAKKAQTEKVDLGQCSFIGLDEWVGISSDNEGSCHYFLQQHIFKPLNIAQDNIHLFDGLSSDPESECKKMDSIILKKGGIDLIVVGIGINGHIGFNEPSNSFGQYAHVAELDEATGVVGQKYFRQQTQLAQGITLGLKHLLEAQKAILIANGTKKADVIRKALEEPVSTFMPASIMRNHKNGFIMIDQEAASMLSASSSS